MWPPDYHARTTLQDMRAFCPTWNTHSIRMTKSTDNRWRN